MTPNLIILSDSATLPEKFLNAYSCVTEFTGDLRRRPAHVNLENLLFVDCLSFQTDEILDHDHVNEALDRGIPIILLSPTTAVLEGISGTSVPYLKAAILIKGKGRQFYIKGFSGLPPMRDRLSTVSKIIARPIQRSSDGSVKRWMKLPENLENSKISPSPTTPDNHRNSHSSQSSTEYELPCALGETLRKLADVEDILEHLRTSRVHCSSEPLPSNRSNVVYWTIDEGRGQTIEDPYGSGAQQTIRCLCSFTIQILAADEPFHGKVVMITTTGKGFEPLSDDESLVSDTSAQRGWFQALAEIQFIPVRNMQCLLIEDCVPESSLEKPDLVWVNEWAMSFRKDPSNINAEGHVIFSYSEGNSHSKYVDYWKTQTEDVGLNGWKISHSLNYAKNRKINALRFFEDNDDSGMNEEQESMFWHNDNSCGCRRVGSSGTQKLKPDCEVIWFAPADSGDTVSIETTITQGLVMCRADNHGIFYVQNMWTRKMKHGLTLNIDMSSVDYIDPIYQHRRQRGWSLFCYDRT